MLTRLTTALSRIDEIESRLAELKPPAAEALTAELPNANFAQTLQAAQSASGRRLQATLAPLTPNRLTGAAATSPAGGTGGSPGTAPGTGLAAAARFEALISEAAQRYGIDADLIHAVIRAESNYRPTCRSGAGAMGLMQLMPGTARALGVSDPWDPAQNIDGGARYLRHQLDRFGGIDLALAAYNAGPNAVSRYKGIPPYRETQGYVKKVMQYLWERKGD